MESQNNIHYAPDYLLNPHHKITVALIGCGGTGSQVLSILARMNLALIALDHPGLHVTVYDDDKVTDANIGRQLFSESEIGSYKCVSLITRMNRFYGTNWQAQPIKVQNELVSQNIYITCVDDFYTRLKLCKLIKHGRNGTHSSEALYWLDFGNTNNTGQAILGSLFTKKGKSTKTEQPNHHLDSFEEWASLYAPPKPSPNVPSCSLAEALEKQDLLINSFLANAGMQLFWNLFREGKTEHRGVLVNLQTLNTNPIPV